MINSELELFAKEYINDVHNVCQMMLKSYNLSSKDELIKYREACTRSSFYLNGSNRYTFHGRGCRFSNDILKIDWDFGYGDIFCGLDPWKLAYYIRDNKTNNEWNDGSKIKEVFDRLVAKGEMIKNDELYYFN